MTYQGKSRAQTGGRIWHPYTRFSAIPQAGLPEMIRGAGIYLFDHEGRRFVDAIASWWACSLGHGHPRLLAALTAQAGHLQHSILGNLSHPAAGALAAALAALMPTPDRHVMFASDGACAVEAALKISLQYWHNTGRPERQRLACLQGGYHGDTLGTVAVGFQPGFHAPFAPMLAPALALPVPHSMADEARCRAAARALVAQEKDTLAALIVEPLCQGAAGMRMYSADYLRFLADLCAECGILLMVDEIAMGFGRTGSMFAFEQAGIDPDVVCVGKALSGGYLPISAAIVKDHIYATFSDLPVDHTFYHGHTFAGNPLATAVALEALRIYREDGFLERVRARAAELETALRPLALAPGVAEVRCLGLIGAVEFAGDAGADRARAARQSLYAQGILVRPLGPVLYLLPPLVITAEELASLTRAFCAAVTAAGYPAQASRPSRRN